MARNLARTLRLDRRARDAEIRHATLTDSTLLNLAVRARPDGRTPPRLVLINESGERAAGPELSAGVLPAGGADTEPVWQGAVFLLRPDFPSPAGLALPVLRVGEGRWRILLTVSGEPDRGLAGVLPRAAGEPGGADAGSLLDGSLKRLITGPRRDLMIEVTTLPPQLELAGVRNPLGRVEIDLIPVGYRPGADDHYFVRNRDTGEVADTELIKAEQDRISIAVPLEPFRRVGPGIAESQRWDVFGATAAGELRVGRRITDLRRPRTAHSYRAMPIDVGRLAPELRPYLTKDACLALELRPARATGATL